MARQRAVVAGRRTGVILSQQAPVPRLEGVEDPDAFFASAQSPTTDKENGDNLGVVDDDSNVSQRPQKKIRFSLESSGQADDDNDNNNNNGKNDNDNDLSGFRHKLGRGSLSPSELSKVSTAPPSETRSNNNNNYEEEEIEQARHAKESDASPTMAQQQATATPDNSPPEDDDLAVPPPDSPTDDPLDDDLMVPPPDSPPHEEELPTQTDTTPVDFPTQSEDDDDDREGVGFQMADNTISNDVDSPLAHEEDTPLRDPETPSQASRKKKNTKKRSKKLPDSSEKETPAAVIIKSKKKTKKTQKKPRDKTPTVKKTRKKKKKNQRYNPFQSKGMQAGPLEYDLVPVTDEKETTPEHQKGLRRSKRSRISPLQFWKNETAVLAPNDFEDDKMVGTVETMPIVSGYLKALPTPYKPRKPREYVAPATMSTTTFDHRVTKKGTAPAPLPVNAAADVEFDSRKLRKKFHYRDDDTAYVWDDNFEQSDNLNVVAYKDELVPRKLPTGKRKKGESKVVGEASQAFNVSPEGNQYPGYIMGHLDLPPRAIKDAESVGACAQTFTVVAGQRKALEVAFSDPDSHNGAFLDPKTATRFLLSPGDMFRVPPGNCYRVENHSPNVDCLLTWTIIRANQFQQE